MDQRFVATDVYAFTKPSECARRVALRARGEPEQDTATAFVELLRKLGHRHEAGHLATLPGIVEISAPDPAERERLTLQAIRDGAVAIYQPHFRLELTLDGGTLELVGDPDFLIRDAASGGYRIRDSKLARNVRSQRHRGIPAQLQIYGLLYERAVGKRPIELEVHAGDGDIVALAYEGEEAVLESLRRHLAMRAADPAAYEPTGWTKCGGCGFEDRCRGQAEAAQDVALLARVSQNRAREFHRLGIRTIADIPKAVDDPAMRDYFWTGTRKPRPKDFVAPLVRSAESWISKTPIRLDDAPELPPGPSFAMFDLEGLPPNADELDRTYLWGVKVFGEKPSPYLSAQAGIGADAGGGGDREGWFAFLALADRLFAEYGPDLPFIHWSSHEKTRITEYVKRYGDMPSSRPGEPKAPHPDESSAPHPEEHLACHPEERSDEGSRTRSATPPHSVAGAGLDPALPGVAARVLDNLVDLLSVLRNSVVLPLPSYSLKVVEGFVGFRRANPGDGTWSIAKYIEATESNDPAARDGDRRRDPRLQRGGPRRDLGGAGVAAGLSPRDLKLIDRTATRHTADPPPSFPRGRSSVALRRTCFREAMPFPQPTWSRARGSFRRRGARARAPFRPAPDAAPRRGGSAAAPRRGRRIRGTRADFERRAASHARRATPSRATETPAAPTGEPPRRGRPDAPRRPRSARRLPD